MCPQRPRGGHQLRVVVSVAHSSSAAPRNTPTPLSQWPRLWVFVLAVPTPVTVIVVPKPSLLLAQVQLFLGAQCCPSARGWRLDRGGVAAASQCPKAQREEATAESGGAKARDRGASACLPAGHLALHPVVISGPWSLGRSGASCRLLAGAWDRAGSSPLAVAGGGRPSLMSCPPSVWLASGSALSLTNAKLPPGPGRCHRNASRSVSAAGTAPGGLERAPALPQPRPQASPGRARGCSHRKVPLRAWQGCSSLWGHEVPWLQ
ncbi:Hypothetical predicted protein [Marmota monax]|uniref:Uncharacterized protein n=1 Tax=Marmota monax TaxID=9995 RepID=A0A5E4BHE5_MARMO|nr:hypothetical protein GHT09_001406 [Marmota monax]VTJ68815.1 Hypothetical predicted protein [Marmota monax]